MNKSMSIPFKIKNLIRHEVLCQENSFNTEEMFKKEATITMMFLEITQIHVSHTVAPHLRAAALLETQKFFFKGK